MMALKERIEDPEKFKLLGRRAMEGIPIRLLGKELIEVAVREGILDPSAVGEMLADMLRESEEKYNKLE